MLCHLISWKHKCFNYTKIFGNCTCYNIIIPRWTEPRRHTVVIVCVCEWVSESFREIAVRISPRALKIKAWNVQCKLNAVLSWNEIGGFWISSFIVELWRDLLTSTAVASNPESSKEQIPHSRLLINMTVQSVQQISRWPEWNPENETAKAKQPRLCLQGQRAQLKARPNLAPTPADYVVFPATLCVHKQLAAWLHCC